MTNSQDEYTLLTALGVSFNEEIDFSLTPEETLIKLVTEFDIINNRRLLSLLILAFDHFQDYYRPDLLAHLVKKLSISEQQIIGGIIFRDSLKTPGRWNCIKKVINLKNSLDLFISSPELLKEKKADESFKEFNVFITNIKESDSKKLVNDNYLLSQNRWFTNRILFGTSSRADIVTIRENHFESNPYRIAKRFNCSIPSITKIWNEVILAQELNAVG